MFFLSFLLHASNASNSTTTTTTTTTIAHSIHQKKVRTHIQKKIHNCYYTINKNQSINQYYTKIMCQPLKGILLVYPPSRMMKKKNNNNSQEQEQGEEQGEEGKQGKQGKQGEQEKPCCYRPPPPPLHPQPIHYLIQTKLELQQNTMPFRPHPTRTFVSAPSNQCLAS